MSDFPGSLIEFQQCFPDEAACVEYLFAARWPEGFACPGCGKGKAWELQTTPSTWECAGCGKQTSVTAGTIMHHSKLPLTTWFWAAYLMAPHSNGISALQRQRQLALGSDKTAWLLCAKLRRSMMAPGRSPLAGLVEVDETEIACRGKNDPLTGGGGRSHQGKMLVGRSGSPVRHGDRIAVGRTGSRRAGTLPKPVRPSFERDIRPIFERLSRLQWVNAGFAAGFGWGPRATSPGQNGC
jgi:transposase-like zinc ribbon protein